MEKLDRETLDSSILVIEEWLSSMKINESLPDLAREVGLLALYWLNNIKDEYGDSKTIKSLMKIAVQCSTAVHQELQSYIEDLIFNGDERGGDAYKKRRLCEIILKDSISVATWLIKDNPELVIRVAKKRWLVDRSLPINPFAGSSAGVSEDFGLKSSNFDFYPASALQGPFLAMLRAKPMLGLQFIIDITNHAANNYLYSDLDFALEGVKLTRHSSYRDSQIVKEEDVYTDIKLLYGTVVKQICTGRLYSAYRGLSVNSYLIESALMALENWLIEVAEHSKSIDYLELFFDFTLRNSNSVFTTAVLVSIATGFVDKVGKIALPLIGCPDLYSLDIRRFTSDRPNRVMFALHHSIYADERRESANKPWRKTHLEEVCVLLQTKGRAEEIHSILDAFEEKYGQYDEWKYRLSRMDLRGYSVIESDAHTKDDNVIVLSSPGVDSELEAKSNAHAEMSNLYLRVMNLNMWALDKFKLDGTNQSFASHVQVVSEIKYFLDLDKNILLKIL